MLNLAGRLAFSSSFAPSCQIDGDLYLTDEPKEDCLRGVQNYISRGLSRTNTDIRVGYHLTSIYGECWCCCRCSLIVVLFDVAVDCPPYCLADLAACLRRGTSYHTLPSVTSLLSFMHHQICTRELRRCDPTSLDSLARVAIALAHSLTPDCTPTSNLGK